MTESNIGLTVGPEYGGPDVCCPLTSSAVVACCCVEDADFIFCGEEAVDVESDTGGDGAKPTTAFYQRCCCRCRCRCRRSFEHNRN